MNWLRRLFHRRHLEHTLDKELRFHLDQHTANLIAQGKSPEEARRQAILALGKPDLIKEYCRDASTIPWLENLWFDLRYAFRESDQNRGSYAGRTRDTIAPCQMLLNPLFINSK